ncbi:MAG: hypothetical protein COA97_12235 [Flavobacteriales bacterium]|nr:MAG: hypothetical protein COA97_12235 [Flavobacteriales bacterium]
MSTIVKIVGEDVGLIRLHGGTVEKSTFVIRNKKFNGLYSFQNCRIDNISFFNCTFGPIYFERNCLVSNFEVRNTKFKKIVIDSCLFESLTLKNSENRWRY